MAEVLDRALCECGCQQPITDSSPSPWWATDGCYRNWAGKQAGIAREALAELAEKDHDPWADVFEDRTDWPGSVVKVTLPSGRTISSIT